MADPDRDTMIFRGSNPEECETFVSAVRRRALDLGKHRDNEWMAIFAASCLAGEAFYWYENLEDSVQNDWSRLRPALVTRFGRTDPPLRMIPDVSETPAAHPPPSTVPTPAAAPPRVSTPGSLARVGRLKVLTSSGDLRGYLSARGDAQGLYRYINTNPDHALLISIPAKPPQGAFEIQIMSSDVRQSPRATDQLAVVWYDGAPPDSFEKQNWLAIPCSWSKTPSRNVGEVVRNLWTITEGGELFLEYTKPLSLLTMFGSRTQRLAPFIFKSGLTVFWMTPDISPYMGTENLPMSVVFEESE